MQNLRQPDQEKIQNRNIVILIHSFNIIFRRYTYFKGAQNSQYFFSDCLHSNLFGYQQFVLNRQLKMMKKYLLPSGNIAFLDKSNQFFRIKSLKLELWELDCFHNSRVHQKIHEEDHCIYFKSLLDIYKMEEIGINQDENILVFYVQVKINFFYKNEQGIWKLKQTINSNDYHQMRFIKFNQSNDIIVADQVKASIGSDLSINEEHYLTIFNKNQYGIWQTTHHIQGSLNPFSFIDDQQFLLFQYGENNQFLSQISILDHNAQVKKQFSCGINQLLTLNYEGPPLIEIKSKNLVLINGNCFFSLKKSKLFWQLSGLKNQNILKVAYAKNSEFLFFQSSGERDIEKKFQVCRIYAQ